MDIDRKQRTDIDTVTNDRMTLAIDDGNLIESPYSHDEIKEYEGNNWVVINNEYVKYNLVEDDKIIFRYDPIINLSQKNITKVIVSFDYELDNNLSYPLLATISLIHDTINYKPTNLSLNSQGHVDIDCSLFDVDNLVLNTIISEQGFGIGLNFNGNKSNTTIKLKNINLKFEFEDKLLDESDVVVNRLLPQVDFFVDEDTDNLVLRIGDESGGGSHGSKTRDTYTKAEVDTFLSEKVDKVTGKALSTNDYTTAEKTKLSGIEANANNYTHPSSHKTSIIKEASALTNLGTVANATQHTINLAIDDTFDDKQDNLISGTNIKTINNESILGPGNLTIQGGGTSVDIVTSWESTPSDSKVASEKLTKDTLDGKLNKSLDVSYINVASNDKVLITDYDNSNNIRAVQSILTDHIKDPTAYTNIGTSANASQSSINSSINNILGTLTGTDLIVVTTDKGSANSSKMNKLYVETKNNKTDVYFVLEDTSGVGTRYTWECIDEDILDSLSIDWSDITNKPSIPSNSSDLSDGSDLVKKSNTAGLLKNDGSIDTTPHFTLTTVTPLSTDNPKKDLDNYLTQGFYAFFNNSNVQNMEQTTLPTGLEQKSFYLLVERRSDSYVKQTLTRYDTGKMWIRIKNSTTWSGWSEISIGGHTHTVSNITDFPTIPSKISDLTNDSDFIEKSNTSGLVKNDGSIDTNTYLTSHNVFYGTSSTSASTQVKEVTATGWSFTTGNILLVKFDNGNTYNGTAQIKIGSTTKDIATVGTTKTSQYYWKSGEVVAFAYDGTNMVMLEAGNATTTYYGVTKLSSSTSSTSEVLAATPKAVKTAYDLANGKLSSTDVGAAALSNSYADLDNKPTIPANVSDLNNDSGFITSSSLPTKTSDLTNDGDGTNAFLTQHQSLSNYIQKSNTSGLIKNDGSIDTTTYLSSLPSHNHDDRYYTESEIDTSLAGKSDTTHAHTTWTETALDTRATLFVNTAIRICELRYSRSFSSATAGTLYSWGTGLVPADYRPSAQVQGAFDQNGVLIVTADGDVKGKFYVSWSGTSTACKGSVMWHY